MLFEEQSVAFGGFGGGRKYSEITAPAFLKCRSWLMSSSFTRLITSYKGNGRNFIKTFFQLLGPK